MLDAEIMCSGACPCRLINNVIHFQVNKLIIFTCIIFTEKRTQRSERIISCPLIIYSFQFKFSFCANILLTVHLYFLYLVYVLS